MEVTAFSTSTITSTSSQSNVQMIGQKKSTLFPKILNTIHIFIICFVFFILFVCLTNDWIFFTWHPFLITVGWVLLVAEGILIFSPHNILTKDLPHNLKVRYHWILQAIGMIFTYIGFIIIIVNKNWHNKLHFQSWHGISGLVQTVCCGLTVTSGIIALYPLILKKYTYPLVLKLIHRIFGVLVFLIGLTTFILSLYSGWFERNYGTISFVICLVCIVTLSLAVINPIKRIYLKLKK